MNEQTEQTIHESIPNDLAGESQKTVAAAQNRELEDRIILPVITAKFQLKTMDDGSITTDAYPFISVTGGCPPHNLLTLAYVAIAIKTRLFIGNSNPFWHLAERIARKYYDVEIVHGNFGFVAIPKNMTPEYLKPARKRKSEVLP